MSLLNGGKSKLSNNVARNITKRPNNEEYNQQWYIWKLSKNVGDVSGEDVSEEDFAGILLQSGSGTISIQLRPATEFISLQGIRGIINLKQAPLRSMSEPDVTSLVPKLVTKGLIETYARQQFPDGTQVFFLTKEYPVVDSAGKIRNTQIYVSYRDFRIPFADDNGTIMHTSLTLNRIATNVLINPNIEGNTSQYVTLEWTLKPQQPINAAKLRLTPKTGVGFPAFPISITGVTTGTFIPQIDQTTSDLSQWSLDFWKYQNPTATTFTAYSILWQEFLWFKYLYNSIIDSNIIEINYVEGYLQSQIANSSGEVLIEYQEANLGSINNSIPNRNYRIFSTRELAGLGAPSFKADFVEYLQDYRIGGFENNLLSQLKEEDVYAEDQVVLTDQERLNFPWTSTLSWWLTDIFNREVFIILFEASNYILVAQPLFNDVFLPNAEDPLTFNEKFFNGTGALDGLVFNIASKFPDTIETTFENDIRSYSSIEAVMVNFVPSNDSPNRSVINEVPPSVSASGNIVNSGPTPGNVFNINLPDSQAYAAGVEVLKDLNFTNQYGGADKSNTVLLFEWNTEDTINSFKINIISGDFILEWLDINGNPAIGNNVDDEQVEIAPIIVRSPQASPNVETNTLFQIVYI